MEGVFPNACHGVRDLDAFQGFAKEKNFVFDLGQGFRDLYMFQATAANEGLSLYDPHWVGNLDALQGNAVAKDSGP